MAAHMALTPCCALAWGRHGGLAWGHKAAHDARRCIVPRGWPASSHLLYSLVINPPSPLQFVLVPVRTNRIGPGRTYSYFCHLPPTRRRQPADPVTVHLGRCFRHMLSRSLLSLSCFQVSSSSTSSGVNHCCSPSKAFLSLSHMPLNEETSISCIIMLHLRHRASRPPGPLLPSSGRCVYQILCLASSICFLPCCLQPTLVPLEQRTLVGGLIHFNTV